MRRVTRRRIGGHLAVFGRGQVVGRDARCVLGLGAADVHPAAARRVEVAHAGGEGIEAVQRLAEGVQAQRLHVVLDVRIGQLRAAAREGAQLRRRHAHRPAARQQVLQADAGLAPPAGGNAVQRLRTAHLEHRADLQVVLQVGADARQLVPRRHAHRGQLGAVADARHLQDLHRADRTGAEDELAPCRGPNPLSVLQQLDAVAAQHAVSIALQLQLRRLRTGPEREVGPAHADRAQEGLGRIPAPAALLVDLEVAHAVVVAAVEVGAGRQPGLHRGLGPGVEQVPAQALLLDAPLAAGAVPWVGAAVVVFMALEVGQHRVPGPACIAGQLGPLRIVAPLAAHVDHAVDAGAAAQRLAARVAQRAAVQAGIGLGLVAPVGARVADAIQVAHGNVDPVVAVAAAGFDQQHALGGVGTQAVGQQAAGGAGADDDVVELEGIAHGQGHKEDHTGAGASS
jgi:hypothetical protein